MTRLSLLIVAALLIVPSVWTPAASAQDLFVTQGSTVTKRFEGTTGTDLGVFTTGESGGSRGLAVGPDLNLYIAKGTGIFRFNGLTGAFIDEFVPAGTFSTTQGIEWGPDNNLYVCTRSNGVYRFTPAGNALGQFTTGASPDAQSTTFGPDGNLYVASLLSSEIMRFDGNTGAFIDAFVPAGSGGLFRPSGLIFGADGNLYVTSQANVVKRYNGTTGAFIDNFASGGLSNPQGIVFGPNGNLFVANTSGGNVVEFDGTSGASLGVFTSSISLPIYLIFYTPEQPIGNENASWGELKSRFD